MASTAFQFQAKRVPVDTAASSFKIYDENAGSKAAKKSTTQSRPALKELGNFVSSSSLAAKAKGLGQVLTKKTEAVPAKSTATSSHPSLKTTTSFVLGGPAVKKTLIQTKPALKEAVKPTHVGLLQKNSRTKSLDDEISISLNTVNEPMELDVQDLLMDDLEEASVDVSEINLDDSIADIDASDHDDPQFCTEYVPYIFAYLREKEIADKVSSTYMSKQTEITPRHRAVLVDWMADVAAKFNFLSETLFLSIAILDHFLQQKAVAKSKLQLVGISAMLIASKYEEILTPEINDFVWITANSCTREELLKNEKLILTTLDFTINFASPLHFLRRFSKAAFSESKTHTLSKYLIEVSSLEYNLLQYLPSKVAAAAVYLSRKMCRITPSWTSTLVHYTGYKESDIIGCARDLNELLKGQATSKYQATRSKYSAEKFFSVAEMQLVDL
eukprot:TRINITY_DN8681_c0_g1_i1.p1 TRINITY_DN8681_c0_g1~~TRINITY_DN8681_c0_g1_i1.p1  ORF type:complete len:455 (+),score=90.38 TRINITY_DN8681_c0_g1_i1:36-1367(+)